MLSAVLSRTINDVATSANRDQMGERVHGRRCLDSCSPGRRLARLALAALALGYANGWAFGPNAELESTRSLVIAFRPEKPAVCPTRAKRSAALTPI